jgi:hypothetical protein
MPPLQNAYGKQHPLDSVDDVGVAVKCGAGCGTEGPGTETQHQSL